MDVILYFDCNSFCLLSMCVMAYFQLNSIRIDYFVRQLHKFMKCSFRAAENPMNMLVQTEKMELKVY